MARRALVIGLGSTGFEVCEQLVERINWEYGGVEHTPWIQFLGLETAPVSATRLNRNKDARHLTISAIEANALRTEPETLKDSLNHLQWMDTATREDINGAIEEGASQNRMIGRLLVLYPGNFRKVREQIKNRFDKLSPKTLTAGTAKEKRGPLPDGSDPPIVLDNTIWVYVVGTLAGGTCSGSFVDIGYLLHRHFRENGGMALQTAGIFMLPHYSHDNTVHRANTLAALQELNHFSTPGVEFPILHPDIEDRTPVIGQRPYDYSYLIQTPGAEPSSYGDTITSIANYLHTDVFLPHIGRRDGDRAQLLKRVRDRKRSPSTFLTFGLSSIEFPAARIVQGCSYKLCALALKQWLQERHLTDQDLLTIRLKMGLDENSIAQALTSCEGDSIESRIKRIIDEAVKRYTGSKTLTAAETQIKQGFHAQGGGMEHPDMKAGFITDTVEKNAPQVGLAFQQTVLHHLITALKDITAGPDYCCQVLDHLTHWLVQRRKELANTTSTASRARSKANEARGWLERCDGDLPLTILAGRTLASNRYKSTYAREAKMCFQAEVADLTRRHEAQICSDLEEKVRLWRKRIWGEEPHSRESPPSGDSMAKYASELCTAFEAGFRKVDENMPRINGHVFFRPKQSVDEHYRETLKVPVSAVDNTLSPQEQTARAALLLGWNELGEQLAQPQNESLFDAKFTKEEQDKKQNDRRASEDILLQNARESFFTIFQKSVLEMAANRAAPFIGEVLNKSAVMLNLRLTDDSRYREHSSNRYGFAYFDGAGDALTAEGTPRQKVALALEELRAEQFPWLKPYSTEDRHRIVFLQERGAFSLMLIEGVRPGPHSFRGDYEAVSAERAG